MYREKKKFYQEIVDKFDHIQPNQLNQFQFNPTNLSLEK